jgi:hypothetical protein
LVEHWASIPKVVGLIARCRYTLRVTSQTYIHLSTSVQNTNTEK